MPKQYTVEDSETNKTITFEWSGDSPPTDDDMVEVFAAAEDIEPITNERIFPSPPEGETYLSQERPIRREASKVYTPLAKMAGLILGAGYGPVGAGLGFAMGGSSAKRMDEMTGLRKPQTIQEAGLESAKDIATGATLEMGGQVVGKVVEETPVMMDRLSQVIRKGIEKGIRPSVVGKRTYGQAEAYLNRAEKAVTEIIKTRGHLQLTDEFGEVARGLPKNLKQFSQAVDQTKRVVFNRYNQLQVEAGKAGATVDFSKVIKELQTIARNKPTKDIVPNVIKYADDLAKRLATTKSYTTEEAQEAIAILNSKLEAFYKNPSYENASIAYIDSMVANNLRKSLDAVIEKASGGVGYQALKNVYGALKTIERDVNRRAIVDARKNLKGLIDFSDIFSGSEVVHGILTMNPARVGAGVTAKTIASIIKHINNPNRIVKTMFEDAEKIITKL